MRRMSSRLRLRKTEAAAEAPTSSFGGCETNPARRQFRGFPILPARRNRSGFFIFPDADRAPADSKTYAKTRSYWAWVPPLYFIEGPAERGGSLALRRLLHVNGRWQRAGGYAHKRAVSPVVFEGAVGAVRRFGVLQAQVDSVLLGGFCGVLCGACRGGFHAAVDSRERADVLDARVRVGDFRHRRRRILHARARRKVAVVFRRHTQRLLQGGRFCSGRARRS